MSKEKVVLAYSGGLDTSVIMKWLKENIHTYGFLYEAPKLMKMVTGEDFDVNYLL